jgi:hypothetical protein
MNLSRRALAHDALSFGRRELAFDAGDAPRSTSRISDDLRLFALTFAGGFLFMSVYLA